MPKNLNALIRYQTIDKLLGTGRKYTLQEIIDRVSEALAEHRGRYTPVSKRTIQDDIRVLRGDILGMNAPIENKDGMYFYSEKGFSIHQQKIEKPEILMRVYLFLEKNQDKLKSSEIVPLMEMIRKQISGEITVDEDIPVLRESEELLSYTRLRKKTAIKEREEKVSDEIGDSYSPVLIWESLFGLVR